MWWILNYVLRLESIEGRGETGFGILDDVEGYLTSIMWA